MANAVKGVIAGAKGAPVSVETILVPDPGPGEALVRIQACGVCHTDLHYREGAITNDFPFLLGHEASGIVEKVGPDVTNVAPGDFVILAWRSPQRGGETGDGGSVLVEPQIEIRFRKCRTRTLSKPATSIWTHHGRCSQKGGRSD